MTTLTIIWLIFTIIFMILSLYHLSSSKKKIEKFEIKAKGSVKSISGIPVNTGFDNFVKDFNKYIEKINKSNKLQNILTSISYFVAAMTCLISFLISDNIIN